MELTSWMKMVRFQTFWIQMRKNKLLDKTCNKMDGVNEPDENGKISNILDSDAKKHTFGRKLQNWPNLRDENGILLKTILLL
ncbi:hypothetical protein Hanom_Chr09g00837231 [Helianthus anomalus]